MPSTYYCGHNLSLPSIPCLYSMVISHTYHRDCAITDTQSEGHTCSGSLRHAGCDLSARGACDLTYGHFSAVSLGSWDTRNCSCRDLHKTLTFSRKLTTCFVERTEACHIWHLSKPCDTCLNPEHFKTLPGLAHHLFDRCAWRRTPPCNSLSIWRYTAVSSTNVRVYCPTCTKIYCPVVTLRTMLSFWTHRRLWSYRVYPTAWA